MNGLLEDMLALAVPMWIDRHRGRSQEWLTERARQLGAEQGRDGMPVIGSELLFYKGKPGDSARCFNALAEAIACMSFFPGGVKIFGVHWEVRQENLRRGEEQADRHSTPRENEREP